uniref:Saposin n=1 Tax=Anopheles coluzzii TaxID=1518534 RepID=A0A6E8VEF0_ANOCL
MKSRLLGLVCLVMLAINPVQSSPVKQTINGNKSLLGAKECTWGPSYWCSNIENAKTCAAVSHCIQTVWEKQHYPVDNDEICNICLDMVKQARDQLESNETQADLKAVFEGSCNLIPIKLVKKECRKLADDFIPELVEALASQMNPNAVCSVAGLCNNAAIDKLLSEMIVLNPEQEVQGIEANEREPAVTGDTFNCDECHTISNLIQKRFRSTDRDSVLESILQICGKMSSYSDACSNIVLTYFGVMYEHLERNLKVEGVCHLSGVCAAQFHLHENNKRKDLIEARSMGDVGRLRVAGDDVPCKLCEQLVDHLRDVLIANTTELEFKEVLEGLCNQTKSFADECHSLVEQYYREIYETLVNNLNSNDACFIIGICPKEDGVVSNGTVMPLLSVAVADRHERTEMYQRMNRPLLGHNELILSASEVQQAQLPIDRIMSAPSGLNLIENGKFCTLCEYFMHFVQEALSEPANEDEIKKVIEVTCNRLPSSIRGECHNFVDVYGDAVIALLIQSINPRQICPTLKMCPSASLDVEIFAPAPVEVSITARGDKDKPTCPLCLFAVSQLEESVKTDRSKENIKSALNKLCTHLSPKLRLECNDFVDTYTAELVEMLASDFTPQEMCVFLKLCVDQRPDLSLLGMELDYEKRSSHQKSDILVSSSGDIETNEIPDITVNGEITIDHTLMSSSPECLVCQEMVKEVEKRVQNKKSKEQIKQALEHACDRLRKYKTKCEKYIDQHSDQIIDLVMKQLSPKEICNALGFCIPAQEIIDDLIDEALFEYFGEDGVIKFTKDFLISSKRVDTGLEKNQPAQCAICEFVMVKLESELADNKTRTEIENAVRTVCDKMPGTITKQCDKLIDQYGEFIIKFLQTLPPKAICTQLDLCKEQLSRLKQSELEIVKCAVCHGAVKNLYELMAHDDIKGHIMNHVNSVCNSLQGDYFTLCEKLFTMYGIDMMYQLKHSIQKEYVCININMCSKSTLLTLPEFASDEHAVDQSFKARVENEETMLV